MAKIIRFEAEQVTAPVERILRAQGIPKGVSPDERILKLVEDAEAAFRELARPIGVLAEIAAEDFERVYRGEGLNQEPTPLAETWPGADHLALFAVTMGEEVCREISRLIAESEYAPGSILDSYASAGADMAAQLAQDERARRLLETGRLDDSRGVLRYSPGYCGWHVSAQRELFGFLQPEEIGITLRESCLMEPLKSVSGVILSGPREIFRVDETYSFCKDCKDHSCRERVAKVREWKRALSE